tara:strand:+ start:566 stop:748 length:183 start_codon:yes stop_codon:yes gene_type:complete
MDCGCADSNCIHRQIKPKIFKFKGFQGTQQEYHKTQEKIKEMEEWNNVLDLIEKLDNYGE